MNVHKIYFLVLSTIFLDEYVLGDPVITFLDIQKCDDDENKLIDADFKLIDLDDGEKGIDITSNLEFDIDSNYTFHASVAVWEDESWDNRLRMVESLCSFLRRFSEEWSKLREAVDPPIEDECFIGKGTYTLTHFPLVFDNIEHSIKGRLRIQTILNQQSTGEDVWCSYMDIDIS